MKCFHSSAAGDDVGPGPRPSRFSWARSLSVASAGWRAELDHGSRGLPRLEEEDLSPPICRQGKLPDGLRAFTFAELKAATRGFSRALMIGEGGFGCVYRGVLTVPGEDDDAETMDVAVKQLNRNGLQGHREWVTEVNFLGVVKHRNLVKLVGYCAEDDERGIQRLLVYELMPNKSLEDHLLARVPSTLSWEQRLKIAQDAARGLAYLHEEMDFQLIFRDFKTSNILLDEDFNAKLSDFGFARHGPAEGVGHVSTSVVGTVGYAAPEYVHTGRLTAKSDVWSYGVVLYELITGRRSVDRNLPRNEQKLLDWVRPYATDPKKFHIIIDPRLEEQYCVKSVRKLITLANRCLMKQPKSRPRMSEVVEVLEQIIEMLNGETGGAITAPSDREDTTDVTEILKENGNGRSRVFDIRELISLKNMSVRKLDWRALAPGAVGMLARTWG
ncbi:serine/threonine-protein kinase PCRK1 [Elaeis guineensis]|uniref:non-specific serine/threonine protein kinase n=1 Tax=Elaeis guineensis var. tenera TaxID=51953 RepID=A0A6I9RRI8_ELAGV|nr:serine/threonine-protein kinase PCRK1 [Elaeis guineensis]